MGERCGPWASCLILFSPLNLFSYLPSMYRYEYILKYDFFSNFGHLISDFEKMESFLFVVNTLLNNQVGVTPLVWAGSVATGSISFNPPILTDGDPASCAFQTAPFTNALGGSTSVQITLSTARMTRELFLTFYSQCNYFQIYYLRIKMFRTY